MSTLQCAMTLTGAQALILKNTFSLFILFIISFIFCTKIVLREYYAILIETVSKKLTYYFGNIHKYIVNFLFEVSSTLEKTVKNWKKAIFCDFVFIQKYKYLK